MLLSIRYISQTFHPSRGIPEEDSDIVIYIADFPTCIYIRDLLYKCAQL